MTGSDETVQTPASSGRASILPGWPTAETACKACASPIIYFIFKDKAQTVLTPIPKVCRSCKDKNFVLRKYRKLDEQRAKNKMKKEKAKHELQ